jgi:hypothetical protein
MKYFTKNILMIAFLVIILINIPFYSHAQIGVPCDYQDPDIPCPIDGGLSALLAIGIGYGIIKLKDQRRA